MAFEAVVPAVAPGPASPLQGWGPGPRSELPTAPGAGPVGPHWRRHGTARARRLLGREQSGAVIGNPLDLRGLPVVWRCLRFRYATNERVQRCGEDKHRRPTPARRFVLLRMKGSPLREQGRCSRPVSALRSGGRQEPLVLFGRARRPPADARRSALHGAV